MITREPPSFKKMWLWCFIMVCAILTAYLGFISLVSVWVGIYHRQQPGFWVPILTGALLFILILLLFLRILRRILAHMKEEDVVHISPRSSFLS
jgi:hypothetical protein